MNTKILWVLLVIVIVVIGAWLAYGRTMDQPADTATTTPPAAVEAATETSASSARTITVAYTAQGFAPKTLTLAIGDTVTFTNESGTEMWVASDEHPTHTDYDGTTTREHCVAGTNTTGTFDQCARSGQGTSWSYTFTKAGSFEYHNHARASDGGTIVVR